MITESPCPPSILFSASEMTYQPGTLVTGGSTFYAWLVTRIAAAVKPHQFLQNTYEMEEIFHFACPAKRISRKTARFACSSLEDCLVYAFEQYTDPFNLYSK